MVNNKGDHSERCAKLMSHILSVHHVWIHRIMKTPDNHNTWRIIPDNNWTNKNFQLKEISEKIIDKFGIDQIIDYSNSKGNRFSNEIKDIFFHVINHSNYHRAQINQLFRSDLIEPVSVDYIFYKR